jgi:hypothetical protein
MRTLRAQRPALPAPSVRLPRRLGVAVALAVLAATTAFGCGSGNDAADELAQQEELRQARQEGARDARQAEQIRQLKREVRQGESGGPVPSASQAAQYVPSYEYYQPSDPAYSYAAEVPTGGGWSAPIESHPTSGELLRTSWRGPDGTLLIIDRTPNDVPSLGGSYDSARTVSQPAFGEATEYIFSRSTALPDCNGRPCADFLINDGTGGGWGVLAGGPSLAVAESIAGHVAQSISYGD